MAGRVRIAIMPAEVAERYQDGWSVRELAAHFAVSYGTAHNRLKAAGVTFRSRGGANRRKRAA